MVESKLYIVALLRGALNVSENIQIQLNGITITSEEAPHLIMLSPVEPGEDVHQLRMKISDDVKRYDRMYYTTDLNAVKFILSKLTLRSSSLTSAKLNDPAEKERVGVEQFAGSRFITCFSHIDHEIASFWGLYGGEIPHERVLLKFRNFANSFAEAIHTNYCLLGDGSKVFFYSDEYRRTIKHNCVAGQMAGLQQLNTDFDIKSCVRSIEMFDVEYLPATDEAFSQDYSGEANIDWGSTSSNMKMYKPESLGKQKSNPWDTEGESRILSCLDRTDFDEWSFIDLRLKDEIFRDLIITMNPWAKSTLENKLRDFINSSPLSEEIRASITITHSDLEGKIRF